MIRINLKRILVLILFLALVLTLSCKSFQNNKIKLVGGDPIMYRCKNGEIITARYYSISDDSLSFVKLTMPDGTEYTLPNVVSASGARFSDGITLIWWTKGDSAFIEERDEVGKWQIIYNDCKQISISELN